MTPHEQDQVNPASEPPTAAPDAAPNDEHGRLTGHAYDGIQEYDNPLPAWWTWIFVATIGFAVIYFAVSLLSGGQMSARGSYDADELKREMAAGVLKGDAKTLLRLSQDEDTKKIGATIFATYCVACHNKDGSGLLGPNLTDDYYINVRKIEDIPDVVANGRNNGAMPSWRTLLKPNEVIQVSAFVASLRGQNLESKQIQRPVHEGIVIPPWSDH